MKTPVRQKQLKDHFTYAWWKYGLLVLLAVFGWSIIYTMTTAPVAEEKKVVVGVYSPGSEKNLAQYMQDVNLIHMPDMEQMTPMYILPDAAHGSMILLTRMAARDCDIYVLPGEEFQSWAAQGAFAELDLELPGLIADLEAAEISLSRGRRQNEATGEKHIYGIPCRDLPGALDVLYTDTSNMYICVFKQNENPDNVLKFMDIFVRDLLNPPPATPTDLAPAQ